MDPVSKFFLVGLAASAGFMASFLYAAFSLSYFVGTIRRFGHSDTNQYIDGAFRPVVNRFVVSWIIATFSQICLLFMWLWHKGYM
jgi:biotin transporter BioY